MTFPNPDLEGLGVRIKQRRLAMKFTLTQLASIANLSRSYLHGLEQGHSKKISAAHLYSIAQSLHVTVEYLLGVEQLATAEDHAFYKAYLACTNAQRYKIRSISYIVIDKNPQVFIHPATTD